MEDVHIVLNGPGAAGTAIIKMLMTAGAKDIVAVDQFGTLYKGCNSAEAHKNWLGEVTNPRQIKGGLKEALEGADVFIGVSRPGILTTELCKTMNKDAIVFAMANPTPEIMPDEAKAGGVRVMATGRSDFPNQVNNVLCFPGLFKGALSVRARDINNEMKLAAAYAIADSSPMQTAARRTSSPARSTPAWPRLWQMPWQRLPARPAWHGCKRRTQA